MKSLRHFQCGSIVAVLFLLVVVRSATADEPMCRKKIIEWGWDEPDTTFMKAHAAEMERMPFDGFVFHVPPIDGRNFVWTMWGPQKFRWEGFAGALSDLQAARFEKLTDRFFRTNVTPGKIDWFDDEGWNAVRHNFGLAARFAKQGGCKGLLFDTEQYEGDLFSYAQQPGRNAHSFAEYQQKVKQRGVEWMCEVNREFPDVTIILTFGYNVAQPRADKGETDRSKTHYGLLADFLDGMFAACTPCTKIVDGWEHSYGYKHREQFVTARETMKCRARAWTADACRYCSHSQAGFGLWLDYQLQGQDWSVEDFSKNYFSPAEFEHSLRVALEQSDEYVWIYAEHPRWWTNEKLPEVYLDGLKKARHGVTSVNVD